MCSLKVFPTYRKTWAWREREKVGDKQHWVKQSKLSRSLSQPVVVLQLSPTSSSLNPLHQQPTRISLSLRNKSNRLHGFLNLNFLPDCGLCRLRLSFFPAFVSWWRCMVADWSARQEVSTMYSWHDKEARLVFAFLLPLSISTAL